MQSLNNLDTIVTALQSNAIGIFPCDTIWGLIGRACPTVGHTINQLKQRPPETPLIQLIYTPQQLADSTPTLTPEHRAAMAKHWPGPVTLILPTPTGSIGVRQPNFKPLVDLLSRTQFPIFSTSVNTHGTPPCIDTIPDTWIQAVDFAYLDAAPGGHAASAILDTTQTPFQWIR
jgi:L-threonylcarbamoyladenylate synthase